jgi:response regulator RpfG family c-di-GMP phosphodiesterase
VEKDTYRILVVDDDPPILELLGEYLATRGHDVHLVADGELALNALQTQPFDVLLTDMKMPGHDGLGLLRHVRENNLPVATILMTGYGTIESAISAMKSGAHNYLLKPFRLREVHQAMVEAVEAQQKDQSALRLQYLAELQQTVENLETPHGLMDLYEQVTKYTADELQAQGALLAFFEPVDQQWVEYARSGEKSAFCGVDLDRLAEHAQRKTQPLHDALCWFNTPKHCLVMPIQSKLEPGPSHTIGFLAVSQATSTTSNPARIIKAYAHLLGQSIAHQLLLDRLQPTPLISQKHPRTQGTETTEELLSQLGTGLTKEENKAVAWAIRLRGNAGFQLRDLLDGGQLDVVTMGGGGLPVNTLSAITPLLKALGERNDGHGSPQGLSGQEIIPAARIGRAYTHWQWLRCSRAFAPRLSVEKSLEALAKLAGTDLADHEVQILINHFTEVQ